MVSPSISFDNINKSNEDNLYSVHSSVLVEALSVSRPHRNRHLSEAETLFLTSFDFGLM